MKISKERNGMFGKKHRGLEKVSKTENQGMERIYW